MREGERMGEGEERRKISNTLIESIVISFALQNTGTQTSHTDQLKHNCFSILHMLVLF